MTTPTGDQHRPGPPAFNFLLGQDASSQLGGEAATIADFTLPSGMAVLRRGKKTLAGIFIA